MQQKQYAENMKTDPVLRREFWGHVIHRAEWKEIFSGLNSSAMNSLVEIAEDLSLEQLTWLMHRTPMPSPVYAARSAVTRTPNPKTIHVWVIYWIYRDGIPGVPLYVGMTRQLSERWTAHRRGSSETKDIDDLTTIRITVIETVCGGEREARIAERRRIAEALLINPELLNKAGT